MNYINNHSNMDEVIDKITGQVVETVSRLTLEEQPYVYQEIVNRLVCLSSEVLLMAYPIEED